jgi:branched-chain amino acid transport system substrate-binding protein
VIEKLRVPLRNPDFAPFLQKVRDAKPDALFVFVPSGAGAAVMKQFLERGMDKAGIKMIATGDVTDDDHSTTWATARSAWSLRTTTRPRTPRR